jgi:hypothetical protein
MKKEKERPTPAPEVSQGDAAPDAASDAELLAELLGDLSAVVGMLERVRLAVAKGRADVRLIPRGQAQSIEAALDDLGDVLTRRTLEVRAARAVRDGTLDEDLKDALAAATD